MVGGAAPAQSVTLSIPRRETVSCIIYYLESQIVWGGWMDGCLLVGLPNICLSLSVFFIFSINNINLLLCAMCDCDICVNIISFTLWIISDFFLQWKMLKTVLIIISIWLLLSFQWMTIHFCGHTSANAIAHVYSKQTANVVGLYNCWKMAHHHPSSVSWALFYLFRVEKIFFFFRQRLSYPPPLSARSSSCSWAVAKEKNVK